MGSYCEEETDAFEGGLVWVRRRNGSWWPGRILCSDELPAKCQIKSGTPIKLLGREDGSMDWYNLEKSKRIKPFHCGEFDEDIEKVKASAFHSKRKPSNGGKYVRREDAIIHALEIEMARCLNGSQKVFSTHCNLLDDKDYNHGPQSISNFGCTSELGGVARKPGMLEEIPMQELSQSVVSFEEPRDPSNVDIQCMQKKYWKTPNDSEDDTTKGTKRMRGLQELGLRMIAGEKSAVFVHKKGSHGLDLSGSVMLKKSELGNGPSSIKPISSSKNSLLSLKCKKAQVMQLYDNLKKKSRHRPLVKVLENTAKVTSSSFDPGVVGAQSIRGVMQRRLNGLSPDKLKSTGLASIDDNNLDSSTTSSEETSSDLSENDFGAIIDGIHSCFERKQNELPSMLEFEDGEFDNGDTPFVMGESETRDLLCMSDSGASRKLKPDMAEGQTSQCSQVGLIPKLNEGLAESGSAAQVNHVRCKVENGRTQLKSTQKRNSEYGILSRIPGPEDCLDSAGQFNTYLMDRSPGNQSSHDDSLLSGACGQVSMTEDIDEESQALIPKSSDLPCIETVSQGLTSDVHVHSAEAVDFLPYLLPFARFKESLLTGDVRVSALPPQKPLPRGQVHLSAYTKYQFIKPLRSWLYDVELSVQESYQGPRVPLISLMSKVNDRAIVGHPVTVEVLEPDVCDALLRSNDCHPPDGCSNHLTENGDHIIRKSKRKAELRSHSYRSVQDNSSDYVWFGPSLLRRKSSGSKKSGFSPRKIRKLSSITVDRKDKRQENKPVVEKMGGPAVACVALRLVFSRINEALSNSARPISKSESLKPLPLS